MKTSIKALGLMTAAILAVSCGSSAQYASAQRFQDGAYATDGTTTNNVSYATGEESIHSVRA